ncbi:MAG: hypothetical protein Tsb0027_19750 [Wenzhouxiangellaceae bacterium]
MRHLISIIVVIGALLCAVALAPMFRQDAGYVLIELGQWTIESNVLVLLGLLLLLLLALKLLFWFLSLPRRAADNLARRRLENGLLALAEGDWQQAEKALSRAAGHSAAPVAGYLAAARAADGHDADTQAVTERQQQYLQAADDGHARTRFLIQLSKARLLINKGQHEQAIPLLQHCLKQRRRHRQALRMLAQCHRELGQWAALRALLPTMRKTGVLDRSGSDDLEQLSIHNELAAATDAEQLQQSWDALLRAQRQQPESIAVYAEQALRFDFPRLAEAVLIQALDRAPDPVLAGLYARAHLEPLDKALQRALRWQRKHPDDAAIQRLLGQLYLQDKKWGKARDHLQESLRLQADADTYAMLGNLLQQQGDSDAAANCFFNALQLGGTAAVSAAGASAGLSPRPLTAQAARQATRLALRPLYPQRTLSAPAAGQQSTSAGQTGTTAPESDRADVSGAKNRQAPMAPPAADHAVRSEPESESVKAYNVDSDAEDVLGDLASVPADFQPAERGAKSKES